MEKLRQSQLLKSIKKLLMIMKLTLFLFLLSISGLFANGGYSQESLVDLNFKNVSVNQILAEIERQSEYRFFFNHDQINTERRVDLSVTKVKISKVLKELFADTDVAYEMVENHIVLVSKTKLISLNKEIIITGKVTDSNEGQSLPGVNIQVKGSTEGTITDLDGKFSIGVADPNATLIFSYVGYATQEVALEGRTTLDVLLVEDIKNLEEVVVVGYGTIKRSDLTGSISSVKGEKLETLTSKRLDQALQGQMAGLTVMNTDGAPGGKTTIRIRGSNSVMGGNNALVVVDGLQGADMSILNPNDIESIEVLKDASATAIYGSRGSNGVILITTKSGQSGKPTITYSMYAGRQKLSNRLDLLNAGDYARTINASHALNNSLFEPTPVFTEQQISDFDANGGTDWQNEIYKVAPIQSHQLSLSGGTKSLKYFVSGGYLGQDGIMLNSGYKRFSIRANLSTDINKWLSFGINTSSIKVEGKSPAFGENASGQLSSVVLTAPRWGATNSVYDQAGNYTHHPANYGPFDTWNPVASALEVDPSYKSINNVANLYLQFKILEGLTLRVNGSANIVTSSNSRFYNEKTKEGIENNGKVGYGELENGLWVYYQNSNLLTYDKTFGSHHITVTGVAEQSIGEWNGSSLQASQFTVGQTGLYDLAGAGLVKNYSSNNKRVLNSFMGRLNYAFRDKYLITASYRADGSSVFGTNNKWGYFPSASVAWKLSEEEFIKQLGLFTILKLRTSIGTTGNQAINPYQTQASINSGENYPFDGGNNTNVGFGITSAKNDNLKWESTYQTNLGLDLAMFGGRLTATLDIYKKTTKNLLLSRDLATSSGLSSIIDNVGSMENKGLEITVGGDPVVGVFNWNTSFNLTLNRNKVLDLGETEFLEYYTSSGGYSLDGSLMRIYPGEPIGQMYGWGYENTWHESERAEAASYGQLPGDPHYTDLNKDGKIDNDDLKVIGNSLPKFVYGWSNKFTYKGFDLDFIFQGVYGNNVFNQPRIRLESQDQATSTNILNRWTPENQNTDVPAFIYEKDRINANLINTVSGVDARNGRWVEDGSYLRLKNLTFGYNFSTSKLSKYGVSRLRVYFSGSNLLTFTKYTGYDPEVSSYNGNDAQSGVDFGNFPSSRILSFGLDVSF